MSFPRPEPEQPPTSAKDQPLRTFTYKKWSGRTETVQAHYIQFTAGHVTFWLERPGEWDFLVIAETNKDCQDIKEEK